MRSLILCLLAVSTAFAFPQDTGKSGGCPGGYAEGAEIERGRLVYVCQGGQVVPKACIAEDLSKIPVGSKYDTTKYRRICELRDGQLSFEPTACIYDGQEHKPAETWEDGDNFYECTTNAAGSDTPLVAVSKGCVAEGKRVNKGEQVPKGDILYECRDYVNGKNKLQPVGCVKDGKQLKAGDTLELGEFWYNCSLFGRETVRFKAAGCIADGKRLNDGDRVTRNSVIYECAIDADKNYLRVMACVDKDGVERRLGCSWYEDDIEYECKYDKTANTATKVPFRCNVKVGNGAFQIDPGCYRVIDKTAYGCIGSAQNLKVQSFTGDNAEQSATSSNLHAC